MKKVLFLIHDLGAGGAEKVLVNLVNNMDRRKFDISVTVLFGGGINEKFLAPHIHFHTVFPKVIPGNSHLMKLLTPKKLHDLCIKDHYDIEVAYLEGPAVRIVSGCVDRTTKLVAWTHCTMHSLKEVSQAFRSSSETKHCYQKMNKLVFVSTEVKKAFEKVCPVDVSKCILYNTNESEKIIKLAEKKTTNNCFDMKTFNWCGVGKLVENKGFDRMLRIQAKLFKEGYNVHFYILGEGELKEDLQKWCEDNHIANSVTFLGYQTNPYQYISKCDLFVCASHAEGFSTAATEALIVGTPVCTVEVSGMKEMLGENNEYGIITENNEDALYDGIKYLLDTPAKLAYYKEKAAERGKLFSTENTVRAVEEMLLFL